MKPYDCSGDDCNCEPLPFDVQPSCPCEDDSCEPAFYRVEICGRDDDSQCTYEADRESAEQCIQDVMNNMPMGKLPNPRHAFTVIELMIVIAIIALLAAVAASALGNAAEQAREQRTRAIVRKLDQLVMERWDAFRTRAVPYQPPSNLAPDARARNRLYAMRELQRMELPDRVSDIVSTSNTAESPVSGIAQSSVFRGYFRKVQALTGGDVSKWTTTHQGSECLYLIISSMRDGEQSSLEYFTSSEIGDTDGDGMPEILDGWGYPIEFLRWAPGYRSDASNPVLTHQERSPTQPDQFDPIRVDPRVDVRVNTDPADDTFALTPLIFSAGSDRLYDVNVEGTLRYTTTTPANDPYYSSCVVGSVGDINVDGINSWMDNITNHSL